MLSADTNDPNQIQVKAKGWDDNRKRLFEKRVAALLNHKDFVLLHVPNDSGSKLKLVKPADSSYHQQRMIQKINACENNPTTWYALSHYWGPAKAKGELWSDISNHLDDEHGEPINPEGDNPIWMRYEKRRTLLALLRAYPDSYWWIDVLCARTDTPLDIMGDIYACCTQSISMIDCAPNIIPDIHTMKYMNPHFPRASGKDEEVEFDDYFSQYEKLNELFLSLTQCQWWKRVWTWQEMVLPQDILFLSETTTNVSDENMLRMDDLDHYEAMLGKMILCCMRHGTRTLHAPTTAFKELKSSRKFNTYRVSDKKELTSLITLFDTFGRSTRECMDPSDYVYGVLGVLQFEIPRMPNPKEVWHDFLSELDNFVEAHVCNQSSTHTDVPPSLFTINDRAHHLDLTAVENMGDVYRDLLIEYKCTI